MRKFWSRFISSILLAATLATQAIPSQQTQGEDFRDFTDRIDKVLSDTGVRGQNKNKLDLNGLQEEITRTRLDIARLQEISDIGTGKNDIDNRQRSQQAPLQQFLENEKRLPTMKYLWLTGGFLSGFILFLLLNSFA